MPLNMKLSSMMHAERSTRLFTSVSPLSRPQFKFQTKSFCQDDIAALNRGSTRQEVLSGELQAGIADMADIDRSVELFTWLWNSMRGGDRSTDKSLELAPQEGGQALAQGVTEIAIFGSGCFWCSEAVFRRVHGVVNVACGYFGGTEPSPSHKQVSSGGTGHAEVVKVEFQPAVISYESLLKVFFSCHDPSSSGSQGEDVGPQYRPVLGCTTDQQLQIAKRTLCQAGDPEAVSIEVIMCSEERGSAGNGDMIGLSSVEEPRPNGALMFYVADDEHQNYYENNSASSSYCSLVVRPKLDKMLNNPDVRQLMNDV